MAYIGVVIPVYNCQSYLEEAVYSILNQPFKDIEIVIVNDGSTDNTYNISEKLANKHSNVKVIHKPNSGVSESRNIGIDYILKKNTQYLAFCDADDAWMPDFLDDTIISVLKKATDIVCFQTCVTNHNLTKYSDPIDFSEGVYAGGSSAIWLHRGQSFASMLYSCSFIDKYGLLFNSDLKYSEDKIFIMKAMFLAENITLYKKIMYCYRRNTCSAMHGRKKGIDYYAPIIKGYLQCDQDMMKYCDAHRKELKAGRNLANLYLVEMIKEHFQNFRTKEALDVFLDANLDIKDILLFPEKYCNDNKRIIKTKKLAQNIRSYQYRQYVMGVMAGIIKNIYRFKWVQEFKDIVQFKNIVRKES